jgi:hypothetical protein
LVRERLAKGAQNDAHRETVVMPKLRLSRSRERKRSNDRRLIAVFV